jgi:hypothetical protein
MLSAAIQAERSAGVNAKKGPGHWVPDRGLLPNVSSLGAASHRLFRVKGSRRSNEFKVRKAPASMLCMDAEEVALLV